MEAQQMIRTLMFLQQTNNRAYCAAYLAALTPYQVHSLYLVDHKLMAGLFGFSGVPQPAIPSLLKLALPKSGAANVHSIPDLNNCMCTFIDERHQEPVTTDGDSKKADAKSTPTVQLFTTNDFNRRSRKSYFAVTETVHRDSQQGKVDYLLERIINKLREYPHSVPVIEFPTFTKRVQDSRGLSSAAHEWPMSYPDVGKGRRKATWTKFYRLARNNFCQRVAMRNTPDKIPTETSRYVLHNLEDDCQNPLMQLQHELAHLRGEAPKKVVQCRSRAEFLAALLNTVVGNRWPILSSALTDMLELCEDCNKTSPESARTELFGYLTEQTLMLIGANPASTIHLPATKALAQKLIHGEQGVDAVTCKAEVR